MSAAFDELLDYWTALSPRLADLHFRAGISTGPLLRACLGHSQAQHLTVIGYPISVAAALCNQAGRDRNTLLVSQETWSLVHGRCAATELDAGRLGKAAAFTERGYEVTGVA